MVKGPLSISDPQTSVATDAGLSTKKATVEKALRDLVRIHRQMRALDALEGMGWEGNLDEMRTDWDAETDWDIKDSK